MAPTKPEGVLIDQFTQPDTYYKYLAKQKQVQRENVYFATKGESVHLAVAASILARYSFVKQFDELSKKLVCHFRKVLVNKLISPPLN